MVWYVIVGALALIGCQLGFNAGRYGMAGAAERLDLSVLSIIFVALILAVDKIFGFKISFTGIAIVVALFEPANQRLSLTRKNLHRHITTLGSSFVFASSFTSASHSSDQWFGSSFSMDSISCWTRSISLRLVISESDVAVDDLTIPCEEDTQR